MLLGIPGGQFGHVGPEVPPGGHFGQISVSAPRWLIFISAPWWSILADWPRKYTLVPDLSTLAWERPLVANLGTLAGERPLAADLGRMVREHPQWLIWADCPASSPGE